MHHTHNLNAVRRRCLCGLERIAHYAQAATSQLTSTLHRDSATLFPKSEQGL